MVDLDFWQSRHEIGEKSSKIVLLGAPSFLGSTYSTATNHITQIGSTTPTYDANGSITVDGTHTYSWDAASRPVTIDGVSLTYDALGRMVEQNRSGTYTEIAYGPHGDKLALMSGQTLQKAFVPLAGGAVAVYTSSGLAYYRHSDWLGSSRFASTPTRTMYSDEAYAPFGEPYAQSGTADLSFTGMNQDTVSGLYDFPAREYATQGRWPSPDPAGRASVYPTDPQTWNRYAYVRNSPLHLFDPTGMVIPPPLMFGGGGGGFAFWAATFGAMANFNPYGGSNCQADGVDAPCGMVLSMIGGGGAVQCPNNNCLAVNNKNQLTYFAATTNGTGSYYTYSGPGSMFYSVTTAGIAAVQNINSTSIAQNIEYSGNIYKDANGLYSYTSPTPGETDWSPFDPSAIPAGTDFAGDYHTHAAYDPQYDNERFSVEPDENGNSDIFNVLFEPKPQPSFLGTPSGRVEIFNPNSFGTMPNGCVAVGSSVPADNPYPGAPEIPNCP